MEKTKTSIKKQASVSMAISPSSLSVSKILSFLSPTKPQFLYPNNNNTHVGFPLSSPSISLRTPENPRNRNGGLVMGTYNVQVVVEENESEERLVGRFRREVMRAGIILESKRRRFFENFREKKKRKTREAAKRYRKRRPQAKTPKEDNTQAVKKKDLYDFKDDNWDLPEGDLPR